MSDEIGGMGMDEINVWWGVREDSNKVTEEAVRRVQDDQKKAQQVGQQIKDDKANNNKFAQFLAFLLKDIKNDSLVKQIYHTFFKTRHEETDLIHLRKNMNTAVVVGMFVPFYETEIDNIGLKGTYEELRDFDGEVNLTKYIKYIKHLLPKFHDNVTIEKEEFTKLLTHIAEYYRLTEKLSEEKALELNTTIKKELSLDK